MRRLLIRPGAIGDVIASLPALECLRSDFTEIWAARAVLPLLRFADRTVAIADTGIDLLEIPGQSRRAMERLREFDSIVSWYGTNRAEFRHAVSELPFTFFDALPHSVPATEFYLAQARTVQPCSYRTPNLGLTTDGAGSFTVIHPFSGSPRKNWPLEHFRRTAKQLVPPVFWLAGPEDELPDAVRVPDLWELAQWLRGARLYIGNDSGITHLAAAVGVFTIAVFVDSDPLVWAPPGARVLVNPSVEELLAEADRGKDGT